MHHRGSYHVSSFDCYVVAHLTDHIYNLVGLLSRSLAMVQCMYYGPSFIIVSG